MGWRGRNLLYLLLERLHDWWVARISLSNWHQWIICGMCEKTKRGLTSVRQVFTVATLFKSHRGDLGQLRSSWLAFSVFDILWAKSIFLQFLEANRRRESHWRKLNMAFLHGLLVIRDTRASQILSYFNWLWPAGGLCPFKPFWASRERVGGWGGYRMWIELPQCSPLELLLLVCSWSLFFFQPFWLNVFKQAIGVLWIFATGL